MKSRRKNEIKTDYEDLQVAHIKEGKFPTVLEGEGRKGGSI